jgi:hypothetical protein
LFNPDISFFKHKNSNTVVQTNINKETKTIETVAEAMEKTTLLWAKTNLIPKLTPKSTKTTMISEK